MSMLAERRRKTKWVINPTKKPIWTTDSEGIKLGKQLMEKMGWSAGKGLGAKEQGIQEPLKVSYKNDTKGMGFKGNDEDWIEHQDEFNSLLSQLSSSDPSKTTELDKNEIKSLEEKSKHSRARVHYQKFTRGKDLSRYSETDLACILGINHNKKRKNSVEEKNPAEEKNPVEEKTDNSYETSFGVTTINSGSILDYFKKKWTIGKSKDNNNSSNTIDEVPENTSSVPEECTITQEHKKSKKRKHDEIIGEVADDTTNQTQEEVQGSEVVEEIKKNRKSKKQKLNEVDSENRKVPENETVEITEEIDNVCDLEGDKENKKQKKSKKKKKEDADNSNQTEEINQDNQNEAGDENNLSLEHDKLESKDSDENFTRKRKKEKKKHKTKESDTLEESLEPVQDELEHKIKKKKKKDREKKEKDHDTQSEMKEVTVKTCSQSQSISNNHENIQNAVDSESEKPKKEKRRKEKHKSDQSNLENDEDLKTNCVSVEVESKSKSKKRKEKLANQSLPETEGEQDAKTKNILEEVEPIVKEKKKKGKNKTDKSELESETKSTCEESEVKQKKKKDKHKSDHPALDDVTENKSVPEQIESEVKVTSKKDKLSERKKSKHKTDSEGVDKSNENVAETNGDVNTVQQQGEGLEKAEIDTTQKEDCKKLAKGNKSKQEEGETDFSGRIFSHKVELFKKKKKGLPFLRAIPDGSPNSRVMGLVFGAQFEKFKGANIENLVGYGMRNKTQGKEDG